MISLKCFLFFFVCLPSFPQTDSEGRLGMRSVLLNATDDGDSKRAKLSYSNRGLYSRTPSTSVTGSTYSSNGLSSGRGTKYHMTCWGHEKDHFPSFGTCVLPCAVVDVKIWHVLPERTPNRLAWAAHCISTFWSMCRQWRASVNFTDGY